MGNKEVRDILLRRIVRQDEQYWTAAPSNVKFHFHGVRDGAGDVRLFGVTHLNRNYQVAEMDLTMALSAAGMVLDSMGRPTRLTSMPERRACLYAPNWIAPVLLTVGQDGERLQVTAYTGRSLLFGRIRCRIAMWIFERRLPEGITYAGRNRKADRIAAKEKAAKEKEAKKNAAGGQEAPKERKKRPVFQKKEKAASKRMKK